ncbi:MULTISPECIES: ABC transporter ATP-binding protein [unclassified Halomonas]|uniref:ABC transporter ATP-binding protein n=1 Tax=unclassified Halomonas TaxID=2609666 RepID=UPI00209CFB65|nr:MULTISPECIES: ABC transporter ATP-binding protein [unclassified Halomonas]MCP1314237.1 ABC transporter ATP-binding protein [Halomonas sp. 707D7]MCP1325319.1 ABC transporter ATP-binding protein [Halomonas sp. 707D4]
MTDTTAAPTLSTRTLAMSYGPRRVIDALDLDLPRGQVTAIVGPNGCGKSTLLSGLARLHKPDSGAVLLDGADVQSLPAKELARQLALLPQEATAPEGLTVTELIRFGRQPHQGWLRQWSAEDQAVVQYALEAAGLKELAERPLDALSGGQRQRAWIAMTIAQQTPLLLLDEPTSALDLGHQIEVFELVRKLAGEGRTVVMVLHDLASACRYADHLIAMNAGHIVAEGKPSTVVTPALVKTLYQVECTLLTDPATGSPLIANVRRAATA